MIDEFRVLLEYGPLGAAFCLFVTFLWWHIKNSARVLDRKDAELKEVWKGRVETATEAFEAMTILSGQVTTLITSMADVLEILKHGGGHEHPPKPREDEQDE